MRATWIIDDKGESWGADTRPLHEALGTRCKGPDLEAYVVSNMGFIAIRDNETLFAVVFEPALVTQAALVGLLYFLADQPHRPVTIYAPSQPVRVEFLVDRAHAIAFVSNLIERRRGGPRFARQAIPIGQTAFASRWQAAREIISLPMDDDVRLRLLETLLNGSFTLNRLDAADGHYRLTAFGSKIATFDPLFVSHGLGTSYHRMSDQDYGSWVAETFKAYTTQQNDVAEAVEALIDLPRIGPKRLSYARLVLPFSRAGNAHLLVATDVV